MKHIQQTTAVSRQKASRRQQTYVGIPATTKVLVGRDGLGITKLLLCISRVRRVRHLATTTPAQRQPHNDHHQLSLASLWGGLVEYQLRLG